MTKVEISVARKGLNGAPRYTAICEHRHLWGWAARNTPANPCDHQTDTKRETR